MFIHIGVFHLLFNLYALYALGPLVEGYFGHLRFLAIYLVGGLFGSLASYALFGRRLRRRVGRHLRPGRRNHRLLPNVSRATSAHAAAAILQNMLFIIGLNLVFGLTMPGIDNWGHIGGLVGGALVALGLLPQVQDAGRVPARAARAGQSMMSRSDACCVPCSGSRPASPCSSVAIEFTTRMKFGA